MHKGAWEECSHNLTRETLGILPSNPMPTPTNPSKTYLRESFHFENHKVQTLLHAFFCLIIQ